MTLADVFNVCRVRGVRLVVQGDKLRAQGRPGSVNDALWQGLAQHKACIVEAFGDGVWPDETLPDVLHIPASVANVESAIRAHIGAQRMKAA